MRILAALLAAFSLNCAASPFAVRLGLERLVLDTPPGFSDTTDLASPRLQDLSAALTSASNRVLMFALTDADFRKFSNGDQIEAKRYIIAVTPKGLEQNRVSPEQFTILVSDSLRELGAPSSPADLVKFLEQKPIGRVNLIAELKKEPAMVSVLQATRLPPLPGAAMWESSKPQYVVFTTTIFLLRGKALQLAVYSMYDGPADVDWVKSNTLRWLDELQRLNPR